MATGSGVIAFNGVGLDNTDSVYRKPGGGQQRQGRSRVIDLGGAGVFDPDAGVDAPQVPYQVRQPYRFQGAHATIAAKLAAIQAQWMKTGTITFGNGGTATGRLIEIVENEVKSLTGQEHVIDVSCVWEVVP